MTTLGSIFARNNVIEEYINKEPFWDPYTGQPQYSLLNNVVIPKNADIREYQLQKIKQFEKKALKKRFSNLDPIATESFENIINKFSSDENKEINKKLEFFVTKINSLYYVNKEEVKSQKDWEIIQNRLKNLHSALAQLAKELNAPLKNNQGQPTVLGSTLEKIDSTLKACDINSLDSVQINLFLKNINQMKGDTLEELGVAYFRNLKIPNIESIRLGSVYLHTKNKNRHSGQLIQDLIFYDINSPELLEDIQVEYKSIGDNKYKKAPLSQLFKEIEAANGQSKQISITDNTYDVITNLRQISIQAKSGKNQLPWNKNKSTSIAIQEYQKDNLTISVKKTFQLLKSLTEAENKQQPWKIKDQSADYNALGNYGLATVLNKVLHLSEEGNQFLLTPYGFMTYSERVKQLLKDERYIALLQDSIVLNRNVLTTKHQVGIKQN